MGAVDRQLLDARASTWRIERGELRGAEKGRGVCRRCCRAVCILGLFLVDGVGIYYYEVRNGKAR